MNSVLSRASVLVSTQWLKNVVQNVPKNLRILDASWHLPVTGRDAQAEFRECHVPTAHFFDIDECAQASIYPHMIPKPLDFEEYVGKLGINNNTHIVVYDNNPQFPIFSAQRVWWTFRTFGHENVSILEGGLRKWISEGGQTTSQVSEISPEKFTARFDPALVKLYEDIQDNINNPSYTVIDARPEGRFQGTAPEPRDDVKPGSIPGSVNIPFPSLLNPDNGTVKSTEELMAIFKAAGVDLNKPLVASCGSGISAGIVALAAYLCGKGDVAIYDGSWTEWYLRAPDNLKRNVPKD